MILSPEEKAYNRAAFRAMSLGQKAEYIFAYYKLPLVIALVVCVALGTVILRTVTHKDPLLYAAYVNVAPNAEVDEALTTGFVENQGENPRRAEVVCYRELYLATDASAQNHEYAYASRLKLMAATDGELLDVVLMNQEAYDLLSASGYLLDLQEACVGTRSLTPEAERRLRTGTVVLSDNRIEVELGEADSYTAETLTAANAFEVSDISLFDTFPDDERLYLGIVANTPRLDQALAYAAYLFSL